MLTACIIVKNEEKHIGSCLDKLSKFVDEIIVVDTGSSDRTLEILSNHKCSIYHFDWCDDFSAVRNFASSKASNDWILVIDADEYITEFDIQKVREFISTNKEKVIGKIKVKSFVGNGTDFAFSRVSRLYNRNYYKFISKLHEFLSRKSMDFAKSEEDIEISVDHFGYTQAEYNDKGKADFYIDLLKKQINNAYDPYYVYHLAVCYCNIFDFEKCLSHIDDIIDLPAVKSSSYFNKIISLKIKALLSLEKIDEAVKMEKYFELCKDDDSYLYMLALVYRYINQSEDALNIYEYLYNKEDLQMNRDTVAYAMADLFYCYGLYNEAKEWFLKLNQTENVIEQIKLCNDKIENSRES